MTHDGFVENRRSSEIRRHFVKDDADAAAGILSQSEVPKSGDHSPIACRLSLQEVVFRYWVHEASGRHYLHGNRRYVYFDCRAR